MNDYDYLDFRDDLLVAVVDEIEPPGIPSVRLKDIAKQYRLPFFPSWIEAVGQDYANAGWGTLNESRGDEYFRINGQGIARATQVRRERKPQKFIEKLAAERTQKLLNVGAFLISILSLVVAILALSGSAK